MILDMRPVCIYTDFFVVCSGRNPRQVKSIWDEVRDRLKHEDRTLPRAVDGERESTWIVARLPRRRASRLHARDALRTTASRICGATSRASSSKPPRPSVQTSHERGLTPAMSDPGWYLESSAEPIPFDTGDLAMQARPGRDMRGV